MQRDGIFRTREPKILKSATPRANSKMGTVKKKILIILSYYFILGGVAVTAYPFAARSGKKSIQPIRNYFLCEAPGIDPDNPCDRSAFENQTGYLILIGAAYLLIGLLPAVNLIFAVDIRKLKQWYRQNTCLSCFHQGAHFLV